MPQGNEPVSVAPADKVAGMDQSADATKPVSDFALPLDDSPGGASLRKTDGADQDTAPQHGSALELASFDLNEREFVEHFT